MTILEEMRLRNQDLVSNASTRLPVCICVDASYSMRFDRRMRQANEGIRRFIREITADNYAVDSVELCIVSFGGNAAHVEQEFQLAGKIAYQDIQPGGKTPLGQAVMLALDKIEERQKLYEDHGITTYKPWLILISDGAATDSTREAEDRTISLQKDRRIKVLCIGIGDEANDLAGFKLDGEVIHLKDFALENFFSWLSKSMSKHSTQSPVLDADIPELKNLQTLKKSL